MRTRRTRRATSQAGQAFLLIVVMLGLFLLGVLGLATDYTQIWAKRQMVQAAADAACQAGAADIFIDFKSPGLLSNPWLGTDYDCSTNSTSSPCVYAAANGYSGAKVSVKFPATVAGLTVPSGFGTIAHPYIKVAVTEPVPMSFTKMVSSASSVNISASAVCGLQPVSVPIPLVVLHPSAPASLNKFGSGTITILGGPNRAIQVDSNDSGAVSVSGGTNQIDLSQAGPSGTGADFGVFGSESQPSQVNLGTTGKWVSPSLPYGDPWATIPAPTAGSAGKSIPQPFGWDGCPDPNGCVEFTAGDYTSCSNGTLTPAGATPGCFNLPYGGGSSPSFNLYGNRQNNQPYALGDRIIPVGGTAASCGSGSKKCAYQVIVAGTTSGTAPLWSTVAPNPGDCAPSCSTLDGQVRWQNIGYINAKPATAIFAPGVYYVGNGGFSLGSGSTVRVATPPDTATNTWRGNTTTANGDGSGGVMFYFSTTGTLAVTSNSGSSGPCTSASTGNPSPNNCIVPYTTAGTVTSAMLGQVPSRALRCPPPNGIASPPQVPATMNGNILFGPCNAPTGGGTNYGSNDGSVRGFLFFQNHAVAASPSWSGGGQFLLAGFMYFHNTSVPYGDTLTMQGSSGSTAFTLGNIVVDKISLGGGGSIDMILNPNSTFQILRPQLLQ